DPGRSASRPHVGVAPDRRDPVRDRGARLVCDRPDVVREGPPSYPNGATIRGPRLVDRRAHRVADEFPDYGRLNPRREEEPIPGPDPERPPGVRLEVPVCPRLPP